MESQNNSNKNHLPALRWHTLTPFYNTLCSLSGLGIGFFTRCVKYVSIKPDEKKVLDIGCGTGRLLKILTDQCTDNDRIFYGVDPDPDVLTTAQRYIDNSPTVSLIHAYAQALPFKDDEMDLVFSSLTFHHLPTQLKKQAFREIYRVLRPGGRFILIDWGVQPIMAMRYLLFFEKQEYLDDHMKGKIPQFLHDAGFVLLEERKVKPSGIYLWIHKKQER